MIVIIQARSSSKRFPNKVLYKINNIPLIFHVVEKVNLSKNNLNIIVATSVKKSDDKLIKVLKKKNINYFRGSLKNVALRLLKVAKINKAKYFLRISADSPLIDYKNIDLAISLYKQNKNFDLITNVFPKTFPKGQSVEIIKTSILKKYIAKFSNEDKEHVTRYFYRNPQKIKILNFKNMNKTKLIDQSVDTKEDLVFIMKKFKNKFINENKKN